MGGSRVPPPANWVVWWGQTSNTQEGVQKHTAGLLSGPQDTGRSGVEHRTYHRKVDMGLLLEQPESQLVGLMMEGSHWRCGVPTCCRRPWQQVAAGGG